MTAHLFLVVKGMPAQLYVLLPGAAKDTGCCAGVGLPCHSQQTANSWSSEYRSHHMERASLRKGIRQLPASSWQQQIQVQALQAVWGCFQCWFPAAAPASAQPSLPGEDQAGAGALQGCKGESWGCTISCLLAHVAAPARPAVSEVTPWV